MLHLTICMLVVFFASDVISSNATEHAYSCSFEEDLCGISPVDRFTAEMRRVKLNGNYVMLANVKSLMVTKFEWANNQSTESCLKIKYQVVHGDLRNHSMWIQNGQGYSYEIQRIHMSLSETSGWKTAFLNFRSYEENWFMLGVIPNSPSDMVAYDDISLDYSPCPS